MTLTAREFWTALHGLILGGGFLLAFAGGMTGLWNLRPEWVTPDGNKAAMRAMMIGTWAMAALAWATVILGTYLIYPWYRMQPPSHGAAAGLSGYPRSYLLANPTTAGWHELGMEWKEHVAWFAPILATAVATVIAQRRRQLIRDSRLRNTLMFLFVLSFVCAAIAGVFGVFINKAAPLR